MLCFTHISHSLPLSLTCRGEFDEVQASMIQESLILMLVGGGYLPAQRTHVFKYLLGPWMEDFELEEQSCPMVKDCIIQGCKGNR